MTVRFTTAARAKAAATAPLPPALMTAIAKLGEEAAKAGVTVEMGGLMPGAAGALVRLSGGRRAVIDGPFTETKEAVGALAVQDAGPQTEALEQGGYS
jgi:hypothetical protein